MSSKIVVITGASSGIGAALAERLARDGHRLALAARRLPELENIARAAKQAGAPAAISVQTDVTSRDQVNRLRDRAISEFGGFDVWINNAGQGISRPVLELTEEDVDQVIAVNLKSALYGMQAAIAHFTQRNQGHLINVSSFLGRVPAVSIRSVYSAAKAALNSLTANLRMDLRDRFPDIHVSLVLPGVVKTGFAQRAIGVIPGAPSRPLVSPPGAEPQTVEEVVEVISQLIDHPVPEVYTNPFLKDLVQRYYADVAAFESHLKPPATAPA